MQRNDLPPTKIGRPLDLEMRGRILDYHREHPDVRSHRAVADAVGCSRRLVRAVLPVAERDVVVRVAMPAELAAWCEARGGVVAVLERAKGEA